MSDPQSLFLEKPNVNVQCILDKEHIPTIGISQPQGVEIKTLSQDQVEISWEEPTLTGNFPIMRYRTFVHDKDNQGSQLNFETADSKTSYKLKTPRSMWGKSYIVNIQAINKVRKMSLVSEPSIFTVSAPKTSTTKATLAAPIT